MSRSATVCVALLRGVNVGRAGQAVTTRNRATVLKLQALAGAAPREPDGQRTPHEK